MLRTVRPFSAAADATAGRADVFTRWGHTKCPSGTDFLYSGYMVGGSFEHSGGGHNYLCLHPEPEHPIGNLGTNKDGALLYGTEYQNSGNSGVDQNLDRDAACTVCQLQAPGTTYVQWGRSTSCSSDHQTLYTGLVMAEKHNHKSKAEWVCVDRAREPYQGDSTSSENGALLYVAEARGGSMDEFLYPHGREVGCSVCAAPASIFTRWGARACPSGTTTVFGGGIMAGAHYQHSGGQCPRC